MRVLMLGWEFPPRISGGLGTACRGIVGGLRDVGHEVVLVLPRVAGGEEDAGAELVPADTVPLPPDAAGGTPPPRAAEELVGRLQLEYVDSPLRPYLGRVDYRAMLRRLRRADAGPRVRHPDAAPYPFRGGYGDSLAEEVERYALAVAEVAARERFDVVHAHDWMTFPAGLLARRVSGKALVCHVHSSEVDRAGPDADPGVVAIEQTALDRADRVVCVSHFTHDVLARNYRVDPERTRVVHNGLARSDGGAAHEDAAGDVARRPPTVLFLGRLTRQKGPGFFLRAAELVASRRPDVRFVVGGDGDLRASLVERAAERGLARQVFFTGFLGPADVERAYARADVYVMPSVSEPFGLAPLEALALDTPVIVSRQSGVAEALASSPKVDYWDVEDLASKILTLLERPSLRRALVRAGRKELSRLRWERSARRLVDVFREVAA